MRASTTVDHGLTDIVAERFDAGVRLGERVAKDMDWCPYSPGYHLYYPNRRYASLAFSLVVDALRYSGQGAAGPC